MQIADDDMIPFDQFWEYEAQKETEDDLGALDPALIRQAVVSATDWTTETIFSQVKKGNILLSPEFQRRDAWRPMRKSRFIESLILGLPIPQLVLAEDQAHRGKYIVLDGKQRLLSICQFAAEEAVTGFDTLKLSRLDIRKDLNGHTLKSMRSDILFLDDVRAFENQSIRTVVIKNWPTESFLYHVFLRLNTNSVTLSPQELRQALHPGPFTTFVEEASRTSPPLRDILKRDEPDFRMRDTELLIRYLAFRNFILHYKGNLKAFLDQSCNILNDEWEQRQQPIQRQLVELSDIHNAIRQVFGDHAYHKWSDDAFENRFNRAIFDIMLFTFCDSGHRRTLTSNADEVLRAFKNLSSSNHDFITSIVQTTKSMEATATRYRLWAEALNSTLDLQLRILKVSDNGLIFE